MVGAQDLAWLSTGSARPGAGPCPARPRAHSARADGSTDGEVANPPLGLRDDLLRDHDDVLVARLACGRDHHAERRALRDLGDALDGADLDQSSSSAAAVSGARSGSSARSERERLEVLRGVEVERERRDVQELASIAGAAAPGRDGARSCPGRRLGRWRRRGRGRVRSFPFRGDRSRRPPCPSAKAREGTVELGRLEQGAVAGKQRGAGGAERLRADDPKRRGLRVAVIGRVAQHLEGRRGCAWHAPSRPSPPAPRRSRGSPARPRASGRARRGRRPASRAGWPPGREDRSSRRPASSRVAKRLTGRITVARISLMPSGSRPSRGCGRQGRHAPSSPSISVGQTSASSPSGGGSGSPSSTTMPSRSPS